MTSELQTTENREFELKLDEKDRERAQALARAIDVTDTQTVIQYGSGPQGEISKFTDAILKEVRAKDGGTAGELLTSLMLNVRELDVDDLGREPGFWEKLPLVGSLVDRARRFIARYETLSAQIETIVENLEKARMQLFKDLSMLDQLHQKNMDLLRELDVHIAAGEIKIRELHDQILPDLKARAEQSGDPLDAQKHQDMVQFATRFEKRLHDLKLSRMVSLQVLPQIRLIQYNNQTLVEKIQSSILHTIPLWKNQIVIAISLLRQKKALEMQRQVTETTNELLQKNSEMLRESSVEAARENERGIVEIETLRKVNGDLISTIEETLKIQEEGRQKRLQAEEELLRLEAQLKQRLVGASGADARN